MKPITTPCLDRWVAALKSGVYRQVRGTLRDRGLFGDEGFSYCGLGVLAETEGLFARFEETGLDALQVKAAVAGKDLIRDMISYALAEAGLERASDRADRLIKDVLLWNDGEERLTLPQIGERIEERVAEWRRMDAIDAVLDEVRPDSVKEILHVDG